MLNTAGLIAMAVVVGLAQSPKLAPKPTTPAPTVKFDVIETPLQSVPTVVQTSTAAPKAVATEPVKAPIKPTYQVRFLPAQ